MGILEGSQCHYRENSVQWRVSYTDEIEALNYRAHDHQHASAKYYHGRYLLVSLHTRLP